MPALNSRLPSYRHHKPSGLAVVTIGGRDVYLGNYGEPDSRAEYDRLIAEWLASGRRPVIAQSGSEADISINEMLLGYLGHADAYYVKNGKPTTEPVNIRLALRPLRRLFGHAPAREFGPLRLKTVRQAMIDSGLCRAEVNKRIRHVLRASKWAVGEELAPPTTDHGIKTVPGRRPRVRASPAQTGGLSPLPSGGDGREAAGSSSRGPVYSQPRAGRGASRSPEGRIGTTPSAIPTRAASSR